MLTKAAKDTGSGPWPSSTAWTASAPDAPFSTVKRHTLARTKLMGEA